MSFRDHASNLRFEYALAKDFGHIDVEAMRRSVSQKQLEMWRLLYEVESEEIEAATESNN